MKKTLLFLLMVMAALAPGPTRAEEPGEEADTETCILDEPHIHSSANFCKGYEGDDTAITLCCAATCLNCHANPADDADLSGQTPWKMIIPTLAQIYRQDANADPASLADLCLNCHDEQFSENINHPVEIVYATDGSKDLVANPDGPKLVCASGTEEGGQGCLLRCVTCHKVHPSEAAGNQVESLLRIVTSGSELCLRCHIK